MKDKEKPLQPFSPVHLDLQCVLFFKTRPPIEPVDFVHRICRDVASKPGVMRSRYLNRLTPMTLLGRATEKGVEEVGKAVLKGHFQLARGEESPVRSTNPEIAACSYAIRPTIRNHNTLSRGEVINQVAALIGEKHPVNLTKPDKVIIIEIFQTVCGMSVVENDWETLKRFNLAELFHPLPKSHAGISGAMPGKKTTDEAKKVATPLHNSNGPDA